MVRLVEVMRGEGFSCHPDLSGYNLDAYVRSGRDVVFQSDSGLIVDAKSAFLPAYFGLSYPMAELWDRLEQIEYGGASVPVLAMSDNLNFLCIHGCKHLWFESRWLVDVSALILMCDDAVIESAMNAATRGGTLRMLLVGMQMAALVMGNDVPERLADAYHADPVARELVEELNELRGDRVSFRRATRFRYRMLDRRGSRASFVLRQIFEPTVGDWRWVRLPAGSRWAYWVLRPIRLFTKLCRGRRSPSSATE